MRENQNRNQGDWDNRLAENQRIGKQIAQNNRDQNWNEQYRSGRDYHNNQNPNNEGRQHYGADPNSSYRNSDINYGDNREHRESYSRRQDSQQNNQQNWPLDRNQNNYHHDNRNQDNQFHHDNRRQNNRNQNNRDENNRHDEGNRYDVNRYTESDNQFYAGEEPRLFDDRKQFQSEDYRYGSGNRRWPGHNDHDNDADNDRNNPRRNDNQERGFFGRLADEVRDDWRTFTHPDDNRNHNRHDDSRHFNRGYESGPRWADESDSRNKNEDRRRNRNHNDNYNR